MTGNDKLNITETYTFDESLLPGGSTLSYQNLYVITSGNTASASEIIRPYMTGNLYQVGEATFGKNVAQALYTNDQYPQLKFWLTTYYLGNADGYKDYDVEGLPADYTQSEPYGGNLGELGTETDPLMQPILAHMATGSFPAAEAAATRITASPRMLVVRNSVEEKQKTARVTPSSSNNAAILPEN